MITGGFGYLFDIKTGRVRTWYVDKDGNRRFVDNEELVDQPNTEGTK